MNTPKHCFIIFSLAFSLLFSLSAFAADDGAAVISQEPAYSLDDCINTALTDSPAIRAAKEETKRTSGIILEAWASIVKLNATGTYAYFQTPPGITIPAGTLSPTQPDVFLGSPYHENYTVAVEGSMPVFAGGRVFSGISLAYLQDDVADEAYRKAIADTVYNVKAAFFGILLAREVVEIRSDAVALLARHYEATKMKYDVGLVSKFELTRSGVELANARPPLIEAKKNLRISTENLKRLLGMSPDAPFEIEGELAFNEVAVDLDDFLSRAEAESPELIIARKTERMADRSAGLALGAMFPTVTAFGKYEWTSNDIYDFDVKEEEWEYTVGAVVTVPISDIILNATKYKQAKANYEKAKILAADTENKVRIEVKEAYFDLVEARELVESQRINTEAAEDSLRIAEVRYENGISTLLELLDTQLAVTQARLNYLYSLYNYEEAYSRLLKIVGENPYSDKSP